MEMNSPATFGAAAYGGEGWEPRPRAHAAELGTLWAACGQDSEYARLTHVLLHRPGPELVAGNDPNAALQLAPIDLARAQAEHDAMAAAYRAAGVTVSYTEPPETRFANQMFCADQVFLTPEGAILARPASAQRGGEERYVAARLAALGIPILRTLTGDAVFEGADAVFLDPGHVALAQGLRTNQAAIDQISATLREIGISATAYDLPFGCMHLMGMLRIVDRDLAFAWPRRTPHALVMALRARGAEVVFVPDEMEEERGRGLNFVTLGPRAVLMADECPQVQALYERHGVTCRTAPARELAKAAGAVGCLTAVLGRERVTS